MVQNIVKWCDAEQTGLEYGQRTPSSQLAQSVGCKTISRGQERAHLLLGVCLSCCGLPLSLSLSQSPPKPRAGYADTKQLTAADNNKTVCMNKPKPFTSKFHPEMIRDLGEMASGLTMNTEVPVLAHRRITICFVCVTHDHWSITETNGVSLAVPVRLEKHHGDNFETEHCGGCGEQDFYWK